MHFFKLEILSPAMANTTSVVQLLTGGFYTEVICNSAFVVTRVILWQGQQRFASVKCETDHDFPKKQNCSASVNLPEVAHTLSYYYNVDDWDLVLFVNFVVGHLYGDLRFDLLYFAATSSSHCSYLWLKP